jgi:hypothetical protein
MELVIVLRTLWRRRIVVAAGLFFALALALHMGDRPGTATGHAWDRVLADTAKSQLVYPDPLGSETTYERTRIAIELLMTEQSTRRMAQLAGVPGDQLFVADPTLGSPLTAASLPQSAMKSANGATAGAPFRVSLTLDDTLPIIDIDATAPDSRSAARLAGAAAQMFEADSSSTENKLVQGLSFHRFTGISTRTTHSGGGRLLGLIAAVFLVVLWCSAVALGSILLERVRRAPLDADRFVALPD